MKELKIAGIKISQNANGLYSLNDLHKASGGDPSKRPGNWAGQDRPKRLIAALDTGASILAPLERINGDGGGTFGVKHILVAYATYLSVEMEIAVQDAFLEKIEARPLTVPEQIHQMSGWMIKQDQKQAENENRLAQLEANADHTKQLFHLGDRTTVKIYCITNKIKIDTARASAIGKKCSGLCRDQKVVIGTSQDPTYGQVNSYPVWVIEEVLDLMGYLN